LERLIVMSETEASSGGEMGSSIFEDLRRRAEKATTELLATDLAQLDLEDRIAWLPRMTLKALEQRKHELNETSRAVLDSWREEERRRFERWRALAEAADETFQRALPPNWNNPPVELPETELVEAVLLDEGLPLAWVPPAAILETLLRASSADERRRLLEVNANELVSACLSELERLESSETAEWRPFAKEAADSMLAGYWSSGQALAANALETLVRRFMLRSVQGVTSRKLRPGGQGAPVPSIRAVDEVDVKAVLVTQGIWGAYATYLPDDLDGIPTRFTRHASAHGVSVNQYSTVNAVVALMHVVALLCLVDEG